MSSPPASTRSLPPLSAYNEPVTVPSEPSLSPTQQAAFKRQHRLGLALGDRALLGGITAVFIGGGLGFAHGARREALRFRAENAHRLPTSQRGWYFYHKSKNYAGMLGGAREGLRMGLRMGVVTVGFVLLEAAADHGRGYGGQQDFLSTGVAGVSTAALWSARNGFPAPTTVRTTKLGLKIGLGLGLLEDAVGLLRGRRLAYVEYGKRMFGMETQAKQADGT